VQISRIHPLEGRTLLSAFVFDPDGPGPLTPQDIDPSGMINGFDFSVGNVLSQGGVAAISQKAADPTGPNPKFQIFYQATLAGYINPAGNTVGVEGLNDPAAPNAFETTLVASITSEVTSVDVANGTATTAVSATQSPQSFVRLYYDNNVATFANNLAGTGFTDGTLIFAGSPIASPDGQGVFTNDFDPNSPLPPPSPPFLLGKFDQFGPDDYGNFQSVVGNGASVLTARLDQASIDRAFVESPVTYLSFNTTNTVPFQTTNPSRSFSSLNADRTTYSPVAPQLGSINGAPAPIGGPDFQFAADANATAVTPAIAVKKFVNGQDANTPPGPTLVAGCPVTFTYSVTNPGDRPLTNIVLVDDNGTPNNPADDFQPPPILGPDGIHNIGDTNDNGKLDRGEDWQYRETGKTAILGQYSNIATVTGQDEFGGTLTASDPANYVGLPAAMRLVKLVNGQDANTAPGPLVPTGCPVAFTYLLTNTGQLPLTSVTLVDDNATPGNPGDDFAPTFTGGDTNGNGVLDPGETWTYSASRTAVAGQHTNTASASAIPIADGTPVTDCKVSATDLGNYSALTPEIAIQKAVAGLTAAPQVDMLVRLGAHHQPSRIVLGFTTDLDPTRAQNIANYTLKLPGRDGRFGTADDQVIPLTSAVYDPTLRTVTLTAGRLLAVHGTYQITVNGTAPFGLTDRNGVLLDGNNDGQPGSNFVRTFGVESFRFALNRFPAPQVPAGAVGPVVAPGSPVVFTYSVTNPGQLPLSNVTVVDDGGTPGNPANAFAPTFTGGDTNGNGKLDPGETWTYSAISTAQMGQFTNIANVVGVAQPGCNAAASAVASYFGLCPTVVNVGRLGVHHMPTLIQVTFSGPVDATQAENLANYTLISPGPDQKFGTKDDRTIPLLSASYAPATNTVTLSPGHTNVHHRYEIIVKNPCPGGPVFVGILDRKKSLSAPIGPFHPRRTTSPTIVPTGTATV
jgi:hypothetical protein